MARAPRPPVEPRPAAVPHRTRGVSFLPSYQLPSAVVDFIGREKEVRQLRQAFESARSRSAMPIVVLSGIPGAGKTTLALHLAHQLRARYPDGQLYVELGGSSAEPLDPRQALGELLLSVGVPAASIPPSTNARSVLFRSLLADRRVLLVADDAADAAQLRPLLPGGEGCAVIVTGGPQLAELTGTHLSVGTLAHDEGLAMLRGIIGDDRFDAEPEAADRIVLACGLLPLALRIAGARLSSRPGGSLERLATLLVDERHRLDELSIGDLAVRAGVGLSYSQLSALDQRAFRFLALLGQHDVSDWTVAALLGEPEASEVTGRLTDASLLTPVCTDSGLQLRFHMHSLLRSYALEQLQRDPEDVKKAAIERAVAGWIELSRLADQQMARPGGLRPRQQAAARSPIEPELALRLTADPLVWYSNERANLLAVTEHACRIGMYRQAAQLASYQASFQYHYDHARDAAHLWGIIIRSADRAQDIETAEWGMQHLLVFAERRPPSSLC
ncbi:AAA family ATPase [Streptacidiphilus sp. P02-A3a]|uniref:AAA family ATPase n=1 Tax=Streptacidiphilus sp. P02-A3a TaxID=2704468 RepID=UPI001CDD0AD4|nr:AAA family ATPase [Streptacidiphilus sp. P02-A3a]QMU68294.1 AAA family ATPase [Streptacidiphilus sp. P02-A3a]